MLVLVSLATPAVAQQEEGDTELQLQGSVSIGTGDLDTRGSVEVVWGRFFSERQEAGLTASGFFDDDGELVGLGGPFYRYNFSSGETVPYVGAAAAASFGSSDFGDGALLTLEAGSRFFLNRNMAFTVEGNMHYSVDDSEFLDFIGVLFGFSYVWGS
jgi:hypothetical protein